MSTEEFYQIITTPITKNKDIIKTISEIPKECKMLSDIIIQLLDFNPSKRISIEKILKTKFIMEVFYDKIRIDPGERIINLKNANEYWSPEQQLIDKLKKENEILKTEILSLKSQIKELNKKNEELNIQNINYNKIINEEPDEENIKKEVELLSQIRTLKMNNQMIESSFNEEKALNKILKEKLEKLEFDYNNINIKNQEKISLLEKKLNDFEKNKNLNLNIESTNDTNETSKDNLKYYLSQFNDNIEQFNQIINSQINNNDKYLNEINNIIQKKSEEFNQKIKEYFSSSSNNYDINDNNIYINNNISWLNKQIDELFPYKTKCLILNKEIIKLQNEMDLIKNKYEFDNKIIKEKEEINELKIKKAKQKIFDIFGEYIKNNFPNKLDEFNLIFKNLGLNNE